MARRTVRRAFSPPTTSRGSIRAHNPTPTAQPFDSRRVVSAAAAAAAAPHHAAAAALRTHHAAAAYRDDEQRSLALASLRAPRRAHASLTAGIRPAGGALRSLALARNGRSARRAGTHASLAAGIRPAGGALRSLAWGAALKAAALRCRAASFRPPGAALARVPLRARGRRLRRRRSRRGRRGGRRPPFFWGGGGGGVGAAVAAALAIRRRRPRNEGGDRRSKKADATAFLWYTIARKEYYKNALLKCE